MRSKTILSFLAFSTLTLVPAGLARTGNTPAQDQNDNQSASERTFTGCLSNGEKSGQYQLAAEDGSTWDLNSKSVKLSPHVGHTVTVTGKVWHADMHGAKEKAKDTVSPDANEHGHLNVTDLQMVSDSCKK